MIRRLERVSVAAAGPLAEMHRNCFPDDPWDTSAISQILNLPVCFGAIVWHDAVLAGFILMQDLGGECEILSLGIIPEQRRIGAGQALLCLAAAESRQRDARSLILEVAADNGAARALYQKAGFVPVGLRPRYYRRHNGAADAIILRHFFAATLS